jgi:hypothetical protein
MMAGVHPSQSAPETARVTKEALFKVLGVYFWVFSF